MMDFDKTAVLGATGSTGRVIVQELLSRGIPTRVVSRSRSNLEAVFGGQQVEMVPADLSVPMETRSALEGCDGVIHCVGLPLSSFGEHVPIAQNVATSMREFKLRCVLVGSFWSYGVPTRSPVRESDSPRQLSRPATIRREQEEILMTAGTTVMMLPDFYGPWADLGFLNPAIRAFLQGHKANWIGGLDQPREFIYVPDVAKPIVDILLKSDAAGQRYNLAGPGKTTARELLAKAAQVCGSKLRVRSASRLALTVMALFNNDMRGLKELHPVYSNPPLLSTQKLRDAIGDYPTTSYSEGIEKTVQWIRRHP